MAPGTSWRQIASGIAAIAVAAALAMPSAVLAQEEWEAVVDEEEGEGAEAAKPTALTDMIPPGQPKP